jgi:NADH-quinone oxidoreductase subunit A
MKKAFFSIRIRKRKLFDQLSDQNIQPRKRPLKKGGSCQIPFCAEGTWGMDIFVNNYVIVAIFLLLGVLLPVATVSFIGPLLRPKKPTAEKQTTYESGNIPVGDSWVRFNVKYYIFALMFVIFDVETLFLYPWAVAYKELGLFALVEMAIFITLLVVGLIYAWRKKVLEWN